MSESRTHFDADVLIAGGGTVGMAAAAALTQQGFSVELLERGAAPPPFDAAAEVDPRVYALSPASMRLLQSLGAWPSIAAARSGAYHAMQVWQDDPMRALRFDASPQQLLGRIVEHRLLNAALWSQTGAWSRRTNTDIVTVVAEEGDVRVQLADDTRLRARLLLVADGPDSPLRQQLGVDTLGWDYPQRALVSHVRTAQTHGGIARQRFLASGPLALLPLADGRVSMVWSCANDLADELLALSDAAFCTRLGVASQQVLGAVLQATPRHAFALRLKHAVQSTGPGFVLAGDAAHVVHPLAGQGVNLGLADVAALTQTLAAARDAGRGWWHARTLNVYARQRVAETREMLAMTDGLHRAFTGAPVIARALGMGMAAMNQAEPLKRWFSQRAQGVMPEIQRDPARLTTPH